MKKYFSMIFLFLILIAYVITKDSSIQLIKNAFAIGEIFDDDEETVNRQITIVIDPGHGGYDPGKVGMNNIREKDINLSIALKLKSLFEENGITVVMTREEDVSLCSDSDSYKKRVDLQNRVNLIHSNNADLAISIHQNSFPEEYVKGAQVFYYTESEQGKQLAEMIQKQIKETIADGNHRLAKANSDYYMLTRTKCPLVIVECGFVTNRKEAALLLDEEYQDKMAWGIHLAVLQFVNDGGLDSGLDSDN